jgi:hypothetical protein
MAVLFPRTTLPSRTSNVARKICPVLKGGEMLKMTTKEIVFTAEGTLPEVLRVVAVKDSIAPVRLRVREWIDERHYRDVDVSEDPVPDLVPGWLAA